MKLTWFTLVTGFVLSQSLFATERCLIQHIREGIAVNEERKLEYSYMSNGKSLEVSNLLIQNEYQMIFLVRLFGIERDAQELQRLGIPFLCEEFKATPNSLPVIQRTENLPNLKDFKSWDYKNPKRSFKTLLGSGQLDRYYEGLVKVIVELNRQPHFNCLTRHLLESQARIARLALQDPRRKTQAINLLNLMSLAYYNFRQLDEMAAPMQAQGVPILCHDLPIIDF